MWCSAIDELLGLLRLRRNDRVGDRNQQVGLGPPESTAFTRMRSDNPCAGNLVLLAAGRRQRIAVRRRTPVGGAGAEGRTIHPLPGRRHQNLLNHVSDMTGQIGLRGAPAAYESYGYFTFIRPHIALTRICIITGIRGFPVGTEIACPV